MRTYCNQGTIFRTISLLLLSLLPARYLPEFFTGYSLPLVTLAAVLGGLVAARSRIRLLPLGLFAGLSCLLVRVLLSAAATLPVFSVHRIYLHITLVFYPSALFFVLVFTATAAGFRKRAWRSLEPLVLLILFAAFFWAQGNHSLTLFPHPFKAALYVVFFIVTIIGSLIFSNTDSRKPYGILAGIVPIFLARTVLFLGTYNAQSVANTGGLIQPTLFRFDFCYQPAKRNIPEQQACLHCSHTRAVQQKFSEEGVSFRVGSRTRFLREAGTGRTAADNFCPRNTDHNPCRGTAVTRRSFSRSFYRQF